MGGFSFLLTKKFHPGRLDNQKRVFVAEQQSEQQLKKEAEARAEIEKEREMTYYENLGDIQRDPRQSSLKFMYSAPKSSTMVKDNEEDIYVQQFYAKLNEKKNNREETDDKVEIESSQSAHIQSISTSSDRPYEKPVHPAYRNAPVVGAFVKGLANAKFKPFNDVLRNVQCSLCQEIGHRFGDRECPLRDFNPHDVARRQREDPMAYMQQQLPIDKQAMILSQATNAHTFLSGKPPIDYTHEGMLHFDALSLMMRVQMTLRATLRPSFWRL